MHIVEVKSSTHVNDIYYHDMAFQTWLLGKCGHRVKSVSLMHINSGYVRHGEIDLHGLFEVVDCTEKVMAMVGEVGERVERLKAAADAENEPVCRIGAQCKKPYPCGYKAWCWREIPSPSVFELNAIHQATALKYLDNGVVALRDLAEVKVGLNARQRVQVQAEAEGLDQIVDVPAVRKFLGTLSFPLYFLDFESIQPAVPIFDGTRPFQQIPTQYSLHVLPAPDAPLEHYEYLAGAGYDPRRETAERLVADIPTGVCTLAYNKSFKRGRIKELADAFDGMRDHLMSIADGMRDLIDPFKSGAYYARKMGGSNSIKYVLPALFPGDPELDYHGLDGVHNGTEAMAAFEELAGLDGEHARALREQLLRYCELDTYAMVKIWQKLAEVAG